MNEETKNKHPKISLARLISAAENEDWKIVDNNLPTICNDPLFIKWASVTGLYDLNGNRRDLGVSILEKSEHELTEKEAERLRELMETDENIYVQYRSSFALFNHGTRDEVVVNKIKSALGDEDVKEDARKYLDQLNQD